MPSRVMLTTAAIPAIQRLDGSWCASRPVQLGLSALRYAISTGQAGFLMGFAAHAPHELEAAIKSRAPYCVRYVPDRHDKTLTPSLHHVSPLREM